MVLALATGHFPNFGHLTANQQQNMGVAAVALGTYPDHEQRGVSQTVDRVVASGNTIVTMGSQTSDGVVRQQFFASTDGGATWRLAAAHAPGGGPAPPGHVASRLAGGPGGWLAVGPQAIWTSPNGLSWTLAATHGIPQLPGDQLLVLNNTAQGFLAAGEAATVGGGNQAVIWTSRDGLTWQRKTATQLGLTALGGTAQGIVYAAAHGPDTVISGGVVGGGNVSAAWLSTDGGSTWTAVTIPADHGAGASVSGLGFDGSGLVAVRPGQGANGSPDGVAYFSPNGQDWQYAGTVDAAGGWSPNVVKGNTNGFVVTGKTTAGQIVAYTSTGSGETWLPTGSLGEATEESVASATVGAGGAVIAVGARSGGALGKQPVFLTATKAGAVRPVSLTAIPGGIVPELTVNALATAGGDQIAVGSADGYPAVWRQAPGSTSWTLVSSLSVASGYPGLSALTGVTHGGRLARRGRVGSGRAHLGERHDLAAGGADHLGPARGVGARDRRESIRVRHRRERGRRRRQRDGGPVVVAEPDLLDPRDQHERHERRGPGAGDQCGHAGVHGRGFGGRPSCGVDHDRWPGLDHE